MSLTFNGLRISYGSTWNNGGIWWTSTEFDKTRGYDRDIISGSSGVARGKANKIQYQFNMHKRLKI